MPVAGRPRPERADAARNRELVLAAARRLFAERGAAAVTIEEVARAAGVAKGTVFHRFGDRAGLAVALLDEHERALQERILRGPPPLGPGAPPRERLLAFLAALAELTMEHRELLLEVERGRGRPATAPAPTRPGSSTRCCCSATTTACAPTSCSRRSPPTSSRTSPRRASRPPT